MFRNYWNISFEHERKTLEGYVYVTEIDFRQFDPEFTILGTSCGRSLIGRVAHGVKRLFTNSRVHCPKTPYTVVVI